MNEIIKKVLKEFNAKEEYIDNKILINAIIEILEDENVMHQNIYEFLKATLVVSKSKMGIVRYKTTRFDMDDDFYAPYIHKKNDKRYLSNDEDDLIRRIIYQMGTHIITSNMVIFKGNDMTEREIYRRTYNRYKTKEERPLSFAEYHNYLSYDFDINREVYKNNYMIREEQFKNKDILKQNISYGTIDSDYYYNKMQKPSKNNCYEKTILETINHNKASFTYASNSIVSPIYYEKHFDEISFDVDIDYDVRDSIYKFSDSMHHIVTEMRKDEFRKQRQEIKRFMKK